MSIIRQVVSVHEQGVLRQLEALQWNEQQRVTISEEPMIPPEAFL